MAARIAQAADGSGSERHALEFAIADAASDAFRGSVLLHGYSTHHGRVEVGFWVVPQARRTGVARAAVSAAVDWAFGELELRRVEMTSTPENPVIPAFARRLGFVHEGTLRSRNVERGRAVDLLWFGLLRGDWRTD